MPHRRATHLQVVLAQLPTSACVPWPGARDREGYGKANDRKASRVVYETAVGPIPQGLQLDHLCRERACVNPDHLEPVTPFENVRRSRLHLSGHDMTTHCLNGHPRSDANTIRRADGQRKCRDCHHAAQARQRAKTK